MPHILHCKCASFLSSFCMPPFFLTIMQRMTFVPPQMLLKDSNRSSINHDKLNHSLLLIHLTFSWYQRPVSCPVFASPTLNHFGYLLGTFHLTLLVKYREKIMKLWLRFVERGDSHRNSNIEIPPGILCKRLHRLKGSVQDVIRRSTGSLEERTPNKRQCAASFTDWKV